MLISEKEGIEEGQTYKDSPVYNRPVKLMGPLNDAMAAIHGRMVEVPHKIEIDGNERVIKKSIRTDLPEKQLIGHARTYFRWMKIENGTLVPR